MSINHYYKRELGAYLKMGFLELFEVKPYYSTALGEAYHYDSLKLLGYLPHNSVNLVLTSPPFALTRKKAYDNVSAAEYVEWFLPFAEKIYKILKDDGSFILHLGGSWISGRPVKHLYQFQLLIAMCERLNFYLAQDIYWHNKAKLPTPAQWVSVKRIRLKDAVDNIWWLSKTENPKADNSKILKHYSSSMQRLLKSGYNAGLRPSGHNISTKFSKDNKGAIRPNFLEFSNTHSQTRYLRLCKKFGIAPHPARFPIELAMFFIEFLTEEGDLVLDPFAGSNTTGEAAEKLNRRWLSIEKNEEYVKGSKLRFFDTL